MEPELIWSLERLEDVGLAHGVTQEMLDRHMESVNRHIAYVQEACRLLGGLPEYQIRAHDVSKYTLAEFPHYTRQFQGPKNDPDGFAYAWMHHIHHNPHHWQHWIFPDGHTPKGSNVEAGVMQMPSNYVVEMVADWMGASKAYTGTWDMSDWLRENLPKIKIHSQTAALLENILSGPPCDYGLVFAELRANGAW
jgi:hypothetical protein